MYSCGNFHQTNLYLILELKLRYETGTRMNLHSLSLFSMALTDMVIFTDSARSAFLDFLHFVIFKVLFEAGARFLHDDAHFAEVAGDHLRLRGVLLGGEGHLVVVLVLVVRGRVQVPKMKL